MKEFRILFGVKIDKWFNAASVCCLWEERERNNIITCLLEIYVLDFKIKISICFYPNMVLCAFGLESNLHRTYMLLFHVISLLCFWKYPSKKGNKTPAPSLFVLRAGWVHKPNIVSLAGILVLLFISVHQLFLHGCHSLCDTLKG